MRHEEFYRSSDSNDDISLWKRSSLCSLETRSGNIFCAHGTAILRINEILETQNPELKNKVTQLQIQLFSIDHQKGELEKYVFQEEEEKKALMLEEMKVLTLTYEKICNEIEALLRNETARLGLTANKSID